MPPSRSHTLLAAFGLLVLALALRPAIVSVGPVLLPIQQHFNLSYTQASLLTAIPDVCMAVFALLAPPIARRFGSDTTVIAALVLLGVSMVLRAEASSATTLLLGTVLVGVGIAIAGALIGGWIKAHFATRASFFMGIYAAGLSVGAALAAVSTESITALSGSWRVGVGGWAVLCVAAVVSWWLLARRFKAVAVPAVGAQRAALPWRAMQAWRVALFFGASQFIVYALFAWLAPAAAQTGFTQLKPGALLALFTAVFAVASFLTGSLAGASPDRRVGLAIACALTALGASGLNLLSPWLALLPVVLIAIGMGMAFTLAMTLPLDHTHSAAHANAWTVFMLFIGYLIAATGPLVLGALRDVSGNYAAGWWLLAAVAGAMVCLSPWLHPHVAPRRG
ncbi:MFS transporter [Pseudomonas sp. SDO528_S397]